MYTYDAQGNRISKVLHKSNGTISYTWYVRDAQGNTLATYQSSGSSISNLYELPLKLSERHLYGSSRLGIYSATVDVDNGPGNMSYENAIKYTRGLKQYELTNHLGNVLATITDRKKGIDTNSDGFIDHYDADITTAQDYYPFGMLMPSRIGYQTENGWTNEPGGGGSGGDVVPENIAIDSRVNNAPPEYTATNSIELNPGFQSGSGDAFLAYISEAEQGSGGSSGNNSSLSSGYYRYGFNGKENDNEIKGSGNQYDYGFRIYDPRISRFLSTDPLTQSYPWYTPYQYAGNKPIWCIDLDGLEEALPKQPSKVPQLTNASESTCIGCTDRAMLIHLRQAQANLEKLKKEYATWVSDPDNLGKPLPPQFEKVAIQSQRTSTLQQGGYLGSREYKLARANYDTYGKFLPGISDVDDFAGFLKAAGEGKGDEATIYALGFLIPEVSGKMLKGPLHHIFTNKNFIRGQQWSKKFAPMFEKAGYKLDDAINKINVLGHKGPHPDEYHQAVFDRLQSATKGLDGDAYKKAFESTLEGLQKEVSTKGTELNKLLTK